MLDNTLVVSRLSNSYRKKSALTISGLDFTVAKFRGFAMYSPDFSEIAAVSIRRLAWAMGANMGQVVDVMVRSLPGYINAEKVCELCKDKSKCPACAFKNSGEMPQKALALLY